jgi:hypothetical protein
MSESARFTDVRDVIALETRIVEISSPYFPERALRRKTG